MKVGVFVGLGSNVDRELKIRAAVSQLREVFGRLRLSPVYDSASVGFDGSDFLNLVAGFETGLDIETMVQTLREIEDKLGRDRSQPKFSRRPIDIDILTYGDLILDQPGIQVPRREILVNAFVLKPLQDIAPDKLHPETGLSYGELWSKMAPRAPRLELFPLEFD